MRIALICYSQNKKFQMEEILFCVPDTTTTSYYLKHNSLYSQSGKRVSLHDVAIQSDIYVLDTSIPFDIRENLHLYFETYTVHHLYGKTSRIEVVSHEFLDPKTLKIDAKHPDLEQGLATTWMTIPHPIRVKRKGKISYEISSVHELRRIALPHLALGENIECVYQPKGRKLTCTLIRNARGKSVYTTPLFEKVQYKSGTKLFSSSLSFAEKEKIIKKIENLFFHYPHVPTLHVELTLTPKGIYLMHAAPLHEITKNTIPGTLTAVGMQPSEILKSCLMHLPTK